MNFVTLRSVFLLSYSPPRNLGSFQKKRDREKIKKRPKRIIFSLFLPFSHQFLATLNTTSSSTTSPTPQQRKNQPQQQQSQLSQQNSNSSKVRSTKRIEALKVDSRDFPAPKPQPRKYKKPETGNRR